MTRDELLELIDEVQQYQSELDNVEVKSARSGTVRENGSITRAQCKQLIGLTEVQARYLLQKMRKGGFLRLVESGRGARYVLP